MLRVHGLAGLKKLEKEAMQSITKALSKRIKEDALFFHEQLKSRTPVWTGHTVANIQWSVATPATGIVKYRGRFHQETNKLALGDEKNRPASEKVADASFRKLDFRNPFQTFVVANNSEAIMALEYGSGPEWKNKSSRVPAGGIFRGAAQLLEAKVKAK